MQKLIIFLTKHRHFFRLIIRFFVYFLAFFLVFAGLWVNRNFGEPSLEQILYHLQFGMDGVDYSCEIISVKKNETLVRVKNCVLVINESPLNITLLQGISSGDRMDYTIQKAVELGVKRIQPIFTKRSVVKLNAERAEKRVAHWQGVAIAACEQSGRAFVPQVAAPISLDTCLNEPLPTGGCRILLNPTGAKRLAEIPQPMGEIQLLIGAEGGLSATEIEAAMLHGFQSIILGPRILRTETAALTVIAAIQTIWGDF